MAADGQVVFEIQGDNRSLKNTLQDTTSAIQSESKKWDDSASGSAKGMESSFAGALKNMAAAFAASKIGAMLVDFGKQAISAASDLEEVQNVVDVTFGESANEINAWAKNAINQFGLTETQAKRFASTMGAMMKSSGIASKDITEMSENLAGLAADMASFYNLDFDEAFNKIRSGISGETEPLKQLGINMSVANLEAFALSQGLKKTFNEMSQGEQVMLRYQYLMQATSDAQGDFSRTSDGFANGLRLLQSNFEQLKTTVGSLLLPVISEAISGLNDMLALLIPATKPTTVLDEFNNIQLDTEGKLEAIRQTKAKADELVKILEDIEKANVVSKATDIETVAKGANVLNATAGTNWQTFVSGLNGVGTVIKDSNGGTQAGTDLKNLADGGKELTGTPVKTFKYDELPGSIQKLFDKANGVSDATGKLGSLDTEASKLTKDEQTGFKFSGLVEDLGGLTTAVDGAATDVPPDIKTLDDKTKDITTKTDTDFKYEALEDDLKGLKGKTGNAATDIPADLKTLDDETKDITKAQPTDFKYEDLETDLGDLVTKTGEAATDAGKEVGNLDSAMADITKDDNTTGFKYTKYLKDADGLVTQTGDAAKDAKTEVGNLDTAMSDITTDDNTTGFKYTKLKGDLTGLTGAAKSAADTMPGDVTTFTQSANKLVGESSETFKYDGIGGDMTGLADDAKTTAGQLPGDVEKVKGAADELTGDAAGFKYSNIPGGLETLDSAATTSASKGTIGTLLGVADAAMTMTGIQYESNGAIGAMVGDIKILDSTDRRNWEKVLSVFNNIPGYTDKIDSKKIEDIAGAFAGLGGDKATAWQTLMDALDSDLTALQILTGEDENGAAAWLEAMKNAANGLSDDDVSSWNALLSLLVNDAGGAGNFLNFEDIVQTAQSLGLMDTMLVQVGDETITVAEANRRYQESMKRLVQLYPELNDLIDSETGEVKGGTTAIQERIDAITKQHEKEVLLYGIKQKELALQKKFEELPSLQVDVMMARMEYEKAQEALEKLNKELARYNVYIDENGQMQYIDALQNTKELTDELNDYLVEHNEEVQEVTGNIARLKKEYEESNAELERQQKDYDTCREKLLEAKEATEDLTDSQEDGTAAAKEYNNEQKKAATDGVKALTDALKDLNDYVERTKKSTEDNVDGALKGFKKFETAEKHLKRLEKEAQAEEKKWNEQEAKAAEQAKKDKQPYVKKSFTGYDDIPTISNMTQALKDQAAFMDEYQRNLETAQSRGVSKELLAEFASDFSQESADFLHLIANASEPELEAFKNQYKEMAKAKDPLVKSMTELKLQADKEFEELVEKAKEAAVKLNNEDVAKDSMASTVQGIADGIKDKVPEVKEAVDLLNAELERLGKSSNYNVFGGLSGTGINISFGKPDSNAKGLDYVPYNNYLSYLHEGEAVLTAEEAAIWRNFKNAGISNANAIDYGRLSGAIWDSAPQMGGNVYLDGRTVGRVISAQQANSYRALERSGWQG